MISYSIVFLTLLKRRWETVRVYDSNHGQNKMQRHTLRGGKQPERSSARGRLGRRATRRPVVLVYPRRRGAHPSPRSEPQNAPAA